jgi:hypothetical protein
MSPGSKLAISFVPWVKTCNKKPISGAQGTFLAVFGLSVELVGNRRKTLVGNATQVSNDLNLNTYIVFAPTEWSSGIVSTCGAAGASVESHWSIFKGWLSRYFEPM